MIQSVVGQPGCSISSMPCLRPGGFGFDAWLQQTFFPGDTCEKNSKKVVSGLGNKSCNPRKEYWLIRGSNQRPPVLKSATLPTELWGSAHINDSLLLLRSCEAFRELKENKTGGDFSFFLGKFEPFYRQRITETKICKLTRI